MQKVKKWVAVQRWRTNVGYSTIGIFGIGIVIARSIQEILHGAGLDINFLILYPLGVIALWTTGFLYERLGLLSIEQEYGSENNTYFEKHLRGINKDKK